MLRASRRVGTPHSQGPIGRAPLGGGVVTLWVANEEENSGTGQHGSRYSTRLAEPGDDFEHTVLSQIVLAPGTRGGSTTFTVTPVNDGVAEGFTYGPADGIEDLVVAGRALASNADHTSNARS